MHRRLPAHRRRPNGFYITTNEYPRSSPTTSSTGRRSTHSTKRALAAGLADVAVTQIDTTGMGPNGEPGFTVWPAVGKGDDDNGGGIEYFMSLERR